MVRDVDNTDPIQQDKNLTVEKFELADMRMLADKMADAFNRYLDFYEKECNMSREEAVRRAHETGEESKASLLERPSNKVSWTLLGNVSQEEPALAMDKWQQIKSEAREELDSGQRAADILKLDTPWKRAQFLAVRKSFIEEWQPRGGIEMALVDQMAQAHTGWLTWLNSFDTWANMEIRRRDHQIQKERSAEPPRMYEAEVMEHSLKLADRFQRMFMRSLRALRDLRRYNVNVLVNGSANVNLGSQCVTMNPKGEVTD